MVHKKPRRVVTVRDLMILLTLFSLLAGLLYIAYKKEVSSLLFPKVEKRRIEKSAKSKYKIKEKVVVQKNAKQTAKEKDLSGYRNWIGTIMEKEEGKSKSGKKTYFYKVQFNQEKQISKVEESDLLPAPKALYKEDDLVQIHPEAAGTTEGSSLDAHRGKLATIIHVSLNHSSKHGKYKYDVFLEDGNIVKNIPEVRFNPVYQIPLLASNSATENNLLIKQAFAHAKKNPGTILVFPTGNFKIGNQTGEEEIALLSSNTSIIGQDTVLTVEGTVYWLALATGPKATDGVKNFTMRDIHFMAADLKNGNQFMIMANHGDNWHISNNSFTMVHKRNSHIFDMGALQNSTFDNNLFVGYAPDITRNPNDKEHTPHAFYSEAIQLDASDSTGIWDGGLLKKIDEDYVINNRQRHYSHNIKITNNQFLPYRDKNGKILAHSASIGQHSSGVGKVIIKNNLFESSVVALYKSKNKKKNEGWLWRPIHFKSKTKPIISGNTVK